MTESPQVAFDSLNAQLLKSGFAEVEFASGGSTGTFIGVYQMAGRTLRLSVSPHSEGSFVALDYFD